MVGVYGQIDAAACVPEQLAHYVSAISGMKMEILNGFPFYLDGNTGVLAAFSLPETSPESVNEAVRLALENPQLKTLSVLSPFLPVNAPENAQIQKDRYWCIDLPVAPSQKTRNMIRRASRELEIKVSSGAGAFSSQHQTLAASFCADKKLDDAQAFIYGRLGEYAASSENVRVFSAYKQDSLAGFVIGDFTSFSHVFYMFAVRSAKAPPGTADLLLHALAREAEDQGFARINLGLGINSGIEFFKKKWGAREYFPHVEVTWKVPAKPGFFSKLAKSLFRKK